MALTSLRSCGFALGNHHMSLLNPDICTSIKSVPSKLHLPVVNTSRHMRPNGIINFPQNSHEKSQFCQDCLSRVLGWGVAKYDSDRRPLWQNFLSGFPPRHLLTFRDYCIVPIPSIRLKKGEADHFLVIHDLLTVKFCNFETVLEPGKFKGPSRLLTVGPVWMILRWTSGEDVSICRYESYSRVISNPG